MEIKQYVIEKKAEIKDKVEKMEVKPHIVIVQVNEDEGSNAYVKGKLNDANEVGIKATLIKLPLETTESELLAKIEELNNDKSVHGLIVQMPLPKQINEDHIKCAVIPSKDIDGFHPMSEMEPCTPKGIIDYLKFSGVTFEDKNAVVIGRSNIVGKPLAKMLTALNANTVILHSKTSKANLENYLRNADIICIAIGKKGFLTGEFIKKSAVIVDVGINRVDGKLHGDAEANLDVALQTPVPGGVGLLTRLTLMINLLEAYNHGISHR